MFITSTYANFTLNKPRTSRWLLTLVWIAATSSWWRCSRGTPAVGWWTSTSGKCDPPRRGKCRPGKRKSSPAPRAEWTQPPSLLLLPLFKSMGITHWQQYFPGGSLRGARALQFLELRKEVRFYLLLQEKPVSKRHLLLLLWWLFALLLWSHILWRSFGNFENFFWKFLMITHFVAVFWVGNNTLTTQYIIF